LAFSKDGGRKTSAMGPDGKKKASINLREGGSRGKTIKPKKNAPSAVSTSTMARNGATVGGGGKRLDDRIPSQGKVKPLGKNAEDIPTSP